MKLNKIILVLLFSIIYFGNFSQITPANNYLGLDVSTQPQNTSFDYDSCFLLEKILE